MNNLIKNKLLVIGLLSMILVGLFGKDVLCVVSSNHSDKMAFCDFMDGEIETDENEKEPTEEDDEQYKLLDFKSTLHIKDFTKNVKDQINSCSMHFAEIPTPPPDDILFFS